jgi:phosphate starvation-inducible protein PhoH and related proteins
MAKTATQTFTYADGRHRASLHCGDDSLLAETEAALGVTLAARDAWIKAEGDAEAVARVGRLLGQLDQARAQGLQVRPIDYRRMLADHGRGDTSRWDRLLAEPLVLPLRRASIVPRTLAQKDYLQSMMSHDIVLGIGPAGTGKTFLAMAAAAHALATGKVRRILLTRPAVEAGEALGFLPGDLKEKILPYLIPLYDALHDMLGKDETERLIERNVIEIAPLAYMRGRTLAEAFVVLDEAQNATPEQMLMFLTRLGERSRMVVTGDPSQVDLPRGRPSGLAEAAEALRDVPGVVIRRFDDTDVVRHPLVERIVRAYARHRKGNGA